MRDKKGMFIKGHSTSNTGRTQFKPGYIISEETKIKMGISRTGDKNHFFGKQHSEKTKLLMVKNHKGAVGKKWSDETKRKMSLSQPLTWLGKRGAGTPNWRGGLTSLANSIHKCRKMQKWRKDVFERDKHICQNCGYDKGKTIEAHHKKQRAQLIKENNIKTLQQAEACIELWNIDNGITLCEPCHIDTQRKNEKQ